jgi:small subunit ribosomal protein S19
MKSKWKVPNISTTKTNKVIHDRSTLVTPGMVDKTIQVHKGNGVSQLLVSTEHVGHKVGEFISTKTSGVYKQSKKKGK